MRFCLLVATLLLSACAVSNATSESVSEAEDELRRTMTKVVEGRPLPIVEVSGLGQRRVDGATTYLAIGDSSPTIVTFAIGEDGDVSHVQPHDLTRLLGRNPPQWEAGAGVGAGRVFVLAESTSTIAVLDPRLEDVTHTIRLEIPPSFPLASAWAADENSRAEGIVLLANGHVLVAKEKNPPAIVELGPRGAAPEGFRPELALGDRPFSLPASRESELVALKHWVLKAKDAKPIGDISELAVDGDGRLYLLSDQGRAIARLEGDLDPAEDKIDVKALFSLPPPVDKPEGLVFASGTPFVATDGKQVAADALYELEPLF